jgi:hypothetical protein
MFRDRFPGPEECLRKSCYIVVDELGAVLTEPNPIIRMATLLWRKRAIVAWTTRRGTRDVCGNPNVDSLRGVVLRSGR